MAESVDKTLRSIYYDPAHTAAYSGINALYKACKHESITRAQIKEWLKKQDTYTLHRPARKRFKRNRVEVFGINSQWQADLVDLSSLKRWNKQYRYLLVVIDCFSKYAHVVPIKTKTGESLVAAFKKILSRSEKPDILQTDKGTEFTNRPFQKWLRTQGIRFFTSNNETKCSIVERFNRTLKSKMWKHFTAKGTSRYTDVLPKLVNAYNNAYHRSIGRTPSSVNIYNQKEVREHLYGKEKSVKERFKFKVGSKVRISKNKMTFEKGYRPNWTDEIFEVCERLERNPPVYRIKDLAGEQLDGTFYEW